MKSVHPLPLCRLFEDPRFARRALALHAAGPMAEARAEVEWLDELLAILEASASTTEEGEGASC